MEIKSFRELFIRLLSDVYYVELQHSVDYPKIIKKAYSEELKLCLQEQLQETKAQAKRIETIFKILGESPVKAEWAKDIRTLLTDVEKFLRQNPSSPLVDAAIIAFAQRGEHFEIATYGTLAEFADVMENPEIKSLLTTCLKEECAADVELSKLAKGRWFKNGINEEATHNLHAAVR